MERMLVLFFWLLALHESTQIVTFQELDKWKMCPLRDSRMNDCLKDAISLAIVTLVPGVPSLKLPPLDPVFVPELNYNFDESNYKMKLTVTNLTIHKFRDTRIDSVQTDWKTMAITAHVPGAYVLGHCVTEGTFFNRTVNGDGKCKFAHVSAKMELNLKFSEEVVEGVKFYHVDEFDYDSDTEKIIYYFEDLHKGEQIETEKTNKIMNDKWREFFDGIRKNLRTQLSPIFKDFSNVIFSALPKSKLTPS